MLGSPIELKFDRDINTMLECSRSNSKEPCLVQEFGDDRVIRSGVIHVIALCWFSKMAVFQDGHHI
jgi:hypothetical protein